MDELTPLIPRPVLRGINRLDCWLSSMEADNLSERGMAARLWGNPRFALVSLLFLSGTLLMPADGFGIRLCLFHQFTGLDCPGCGMTRGVAQIWRGNLLQAVELHLFAPLAFLFLGLQSAALALPGGMRGAVLDWMDRRDSCLRWLWMLLAFAFFAYGAFRIAAAILP